MKLSAVLLVLFLSFTVFAENRVCQIKNQDPSVSNSVEHQFSFSTEKGGQSIFKNYLTMFFSRNGYLFLVVKDNKRDIKVTGQFSLKQDHLSLHISPHFKLNCYSDSRFSKMRTMQKDNSFDSTISDIAELKDYTMRMAIKVNRTLTFIYNQRNVQQGMRPIIFQYGNVYTADTPREESKNHCTFNIGIKANKDIQIFAGTLLKVSDVKVLDNSSSRFVISYSFVDSSTGKQMIAHSEYSPLSLECSIRKEDKFTYKMFKHITGDRLELGLKK